MAQQNGEWGGEWQESPGPPKRKAGLAARKPSEQAS